MDKIRTLDDDLDEIYDFTYYLMCEDKWDVLETIFEYITINVQKYDVNILLGWITSTFTGKHKIINRKKLLHKCRELHPDDRQWKGWD